MEQKLRRNTTLGDNLRRLRKAAGLTQAMAVAQLQLLGFDISREILSQMENGRYNVPVSLLKALKQIYKVPSYDDFPGPNRKACKEANHAPSFDGFFQGA